MEESAVVTINILDDTGKVVETLIERQLYPAGKHMVSFDPARDKPVRYWYEISAEIAGKKSVDIGQIA